MGERAKRAPRSWRAVRPAVYPVARRERDAAPPGPPRKSSEGGRRVLQIWRTQLAPPDGLPKALRLGKSGANDDCVPLRKANDSHSTPRACARLVSKLHDACDASETRHHVPGGRCLREVRGDGSRRDARAKAAPDTSSFFVILCAFPGIFARKKTRRRDPRSARARALVADTPILPPAPDPPAVARAPSSRAPRPSAAALPRPRARANAHRKTDGSSAKRPRQRRGSRAMAPRGGRACRAFHKNTGWNPTRGNL